MKKTESPRILDNNLQREWPIETATVASISRDIDLMAAASLRGAGLIRLRQSDRRALAYPAWVDASRSQRTAGPMVK